MDNRLKKSLELLKTRAKRLRQRGQDHGSKGTVVPPSLPTRMTFEEEWEQISRLKGPSQSLEEVAPGEEILNESGTCYLIRPNDRFSGDASGEELVRERGRLVEVVATPEVLGRLFSKEPAHVFNREEPLTPENICFFDIETAGLTPNTYVFLCGVMVVSEVGLAVEQYLARDYSEEKTLLTVLGKRLEEFEYVVTYNGLTFDIPFIRTRMAVHRIEFEERFQTLDLLKPARHTYSGVLPNCKLETIERHLRGVSRSGDIPGKFVPRVYHDFVRTLDARLLGGVLYHNQMDLLAMVMLLNSLALPT